MKHIKYILLIIFVLISCSDVGPFQSILAPPYCDKENACNFESEEECIYAETNYNCDGNCIVNIDCFGECGGDATEDECGICNGQGIADGECDCDGNMNDCAGECGGNAVIDECGICGGDNATCQDCNGDINGTAYIDGCGDCVEGNTENEPCPIDCNGIDGGTAYVDECGECVDANDASCVQGCDGAWENDGSELEIDECGVCGGDNTTCQDCNGDINGTAYTDQCGTCDSDSSNDCIQDCNGNWGGSAVEDECGICNGQGIADGVCDCDGNIEDCAGECGGIAVVDECGICDGAGANYECWDASFVCDEAECSDQPNNNLSIYYNNTSSSHISGFQFTVTGVDVLGGSGGASEDAGFSVSTGNNIVIGFSLTGSAIPQGEGLLLNLEIDGDNSQGCLTDLTFSDSNGDALNVMLEDCVNILIIQDTEEVGCMDINACNYNPQATVDDGSCDYGDTCWDGSLECDLVDCPNLTVDILYDSHLEIGGFQFYVDSGILIGASGGAAGAANFQISTSSLGDGQGIVIGFSLTGSTIPAGSGTLVSLEIEDTDAACITDLVLSDISGAAIDYELDCTSFVTIEGFDACADIECPDYCDGFILYDSGYCVDGACFYNLVSDSNECGICDGVTCPDYCQGNYLYSNGSCYAGYCMYDNDAYCPYGCDNAQCNAAGSSADCSSPYYCSDCYGCSSSCCPNYCSGNYYYYNRSCSNGFCVGATSDYCPNGCNSNGCID